MPQKTIRAKLPVEIFKEEKQFIAYCPALDISTSADTLAKVKKMFSELVSVFFEETLKMGTLEKVLEQCGWTKATKPKLHWKPPIRRFITELEEEVSLPCPV